MGRDRLRRVRLGAVAGAGLLTLAVCTTAGVADARPEPGGVPVVAARPSGAPATASPATGPDSGRSPGTGTSPTPAGSTPTASIGASEGTLRVLTFQGHVEYGGTLQGVNWVTQFEEKTGCRVVTLDRVRSAEEMAAKLDGGSYDVVSPPPELAGLLAAEGAVAPVDTSLVEAYDEIPERLRELPALRRGETVYGVPYLWGVNQTLYGEGRYDGPGALYETGPVAIRNTPLSIADAALVLRETEPGLGIEDPFQLTPAQLDAAEKLLAGRDGADRIYWDDSIEVIRAMAGGSVRLAQAWPYHADLFKRAGRPVRTFDKAPVTGWMDSWMLAARPASPNCAYKWLNWVTSADTQRSAAAWTGLAPANTEACTGRARSVCDLYRAEDAARLGEVFFAVRPARDCGGGNGECTDYADWVSRWKKLVD
ncbi:ABC transporter substrate-binding protein [Planomonospora sp. ID67723]|uniref:extracellular solute-binding protein n=1 Tax=Planomonospora sp. ID67723 TaxID=2738134 RepID=UPI0018C3E69F|nr:extracellular solute-binding protein [Planomonospora sp. ID67723]MBG0828650.1 ABC transporter substrate-binding protein [Planomonospora sp. ID67723]